MSGESQKSGHLALGFELSTQSAKWIVIDTRAGGGRDAGGQDAGGRAGAGNSSGSSSDPAGAGSSSGAVVSSGGLEYDSEFPHYGTRGGVLAAEDSQLRHAPPALYLDALDRIFARLVEEGVDTADIGAIKCDAHQHCSVYTDASLDAHLASLGVAARRAESTGQGRAGVADEAIGTGHAGHGAHGGRGEHADDRVAGDCLAAHLLDSFTRETSPIWEDRTTEKEAAALTKALSKVKPADSASGVTSSGGSGIEELTGNRAELRFPASQIIRWANVDPKDYRRTAHIQLLSAFLTSVLSGHIAPVDTGDGWGTNLNHLDINWPGFSPEAVAATAKLCGESGPQRLSYQIGDMVAYDTPLGTVSEYFVRRYGVNSEAVILAGTGDNPATLLGVGDGALVSMGSSYTVCGPVSEPKPSADGSYNIFGYRPGFAMALTVITNGGKLHREFCDRYAGGDWSRYAELAGSREIDPENEPLMLPYLSDESVPVAPAGIVRDGFDESDAEANVRALHLSQVASMRVHSQHLADVRRVNVVGGGAANVFLRQAIADAFGATVTVADNAAAAAPFGCALSAARYALGTSYEDVVHRFAGGSEECHARSEMTSAWEKLLGRYQKLEQSKTHQ